MEKVQAVSKGIEMRQHFPCVFGASYKADSDDPIRMQSENVGPDQLGLSLTGVRLFLLSHLYAGVFDFLQYPH
jgi:hypothetical protein